MKKDKHHFNEKKNFKNELMVESFSDYLNFVYDKDLYFNFIENLDLSGYQKWSYTQNY